MYNVIKIKFAFLVNRKALQDSLISLMNSEKESIFYNIFSMMQHNLRTSLDFKRISLQFPFSVN